MLAHFIAFCIGTAFEFVVLLAVLQVLRRPMDLTFPQPLMRHLLTAAVMAAAVVGGALLVPWPFVGWIGLLAVGWAVTKFYDGDLLAAFFVVVCTWGATQLVSLWILAAVKRAL